MKKTSPAMSDCPIKSGVILEKGVCDDRALQRKPIKIRSHQKKLAPALQPAATVQDSQDNLLQLLCCCRQRGCKHWLHFLCFNVQCSMLCVWELESGYLSIDKRVAVTPLLIVGDNLSPALVTQPRSA